MNIPKDLKYTKSHEWLQFINETTARVGLTDYAQNALGDLVFINLPEEGDSVVTGDSFGDVESVKAVSDIYSPVTGTVSKVNEETLNSPEAINKDAYSAWLIEVKDITDNEEFLTAGEYEKLCQEDA
jgi:glycine cleavage system H protein